MDSVSRRDFVAGLAVLGVGGLVLRADAQPTPPAGEAGEYGKFLRDGGPAPAAPAGGKWAPTEDCILGPFYRPGAPFRAKVTPPLEPGVVLLIRGRVWGHDTRKPLAGARLDVWQANARGRYDNDDPDNPPKKDVFVNRARLIADETGYYEFESVHPGPYKIGPETWRPSHIHYAISHPGYRTLVTQLFFRGDPHNKTDEFIKESLIIDLRTVRVGAQTYEAGVFDIVLAPAARK
jgi:protocatechuate 3,4-dioxygenase beta subunit